MAGMTPEQQNHAASCFRMACRHAGRGCRDSNDFDDRLSDAFLGLCQAALAFDPERGLRFTTLAWYCVGNAIRHGWSARQKHSREQTVDPDEPNPLNRLQAPEPEEEPDPDDWRLVLLVRLGQALRHLPPRTRRIIELRLLGNCWDVVGWQVRLSPRKCKDTYHSALRRLRALIGPATRRVVK